jgi:drug/metabolite transporter (DMT)-like permease
MLSKISLRAKTLAMVAIMVSCSCTGDILLSKGMKQVGEVSFNSFGALASTFLQIIGNGRVWLAILFLSLYTLSYIVVLSWADYSYVQPVAAIGYAIVPLLGYLVLGESVTMLRWAGVAFICLGVLLITRTQPRTTEPLP